MSNITEVTFTVERYAVTAPLYQYDYGQVLKITAPSLPDPYTVHFGNARSSGESLTVIGTSSDGAAIPSALLATGLNVYAWVFLHTGENDGETEYMIEIPVIRRAEPTDDPVIEEDPSAVDIIMGEISSLKEDIENISGISDDVKTALLQIASKVAYIDADGQDYYDALENALYPPSDLVSISCVYTQSRTVYDTDSLDSLKADLVVTAHYSDSTTGTVTNYVLSGTLTAGTSTITVTYGGKTTTFAVTVTEEPALYPLTNGTFTFSGNYGQIITISNGNHVKIEYPNGDPYSNGCLINISTLSKNGNVSTSNQSAVNNLQDVLFTIPAGATAKLEAKNFTPSRANLFRNETHKQFLINARKTELSTSALTSIGYFDDMSSDTFTSEKVVTEATDVSCFFIYEQHIANGVTVEFDLSLIVNGARWI